MNESSKSMHSTRKATAAALLGNGYVVQPQNGRRRHVSASRVWANGTNNRAQTCTLGDLING